MKVIFAIAALGLLAGCATVTLEDLALQCDAYGLERNTPDHAQCLQQEVRAYEARQAAYAARMQAVGQSLQQMDSAGYSQPSTQSYQSAQGPLVQDVVSGTNRICTYNVMGSASVRTIPAVSLCPQWGN